MSISVMLKPASSNCNLKCEYCFYHSLSAERQDFSKGMMSIDTAKRVIDSALDFAKGTDVYFTFQGGEPLLCDISFYKEFVSYIKESNTQNSPVHLCLQTNGTLITEEYAEFFKKNNFLIGVSLDGDEEINSYRFYPDGSNSFNDVMRGIDLLKKHGVTFNILSVLTKKTAQNFRKAYRFFKGNDLRFLQFIPCLRPLKSDFDEELYMNSDDYAEFLTRGFNIYFNDYMRGEYVSVRSFDNYISLASGGNAEQCGMNGVCSTQFVVEGDGSVYPCDFYCTDEWYLGNINVSSFDELYHGERAVEFLKESFKLPDECKNCSFFYVCRGGGCKRNRQDKDYCNAYKKFFASSEYKMKQMKG
ncbi:MAG: radical SAM protein [Eubacterium sp.]|nr:radical SAM protein [Eubacterium sp.]